MELSKKVLDSISYNPISGGFFWKVDAGRNGKIRKGSPAGTVNSNGRLHIKIDNQKVLAHRIAWFIINGVWPRNLIDHINGDPLDNRIENLREATFSENTQNCRTRSDNELGLKNIRKDKRTNKYQVRVSIGGITRSFGSFETEQEAIDVAHTARITLHGAFVNHGI